MKDTKKIGSETAKRGFANEDYIVAKFNNWIEDKDAQSWLAIMGYSLAEIKQVVAVKLHGYKTDIQVQVTITLKCGIDCQNIQVKLVSNPKGFNQIDKRWVNRYMELWDIPEEVAYLLKLYVGEEKIPKDQQVTTQKQNRLFANEFSVEQQTCLLNWLRDNQLMIVSDILKGRGQFSAEWMLVVQKSLSTSRWALHPINKCLNHYGNGDVYITPRGSIKIGRITMQRKGGDGGRITAQMLQFKINPAELFEI